MRAPRRQNPDWYQPWRYSDPTLEGGDLPSNTINVHQGARRDLVLYRPDGAELTRIVDRPFRGYQGGAR